MIREVIEMSGDPETCLVCKEGFKFGVSYTIPGFDKEFLFCIECADSLSITELEEIIEKKEEK